MKERNCHKAFEKCDIGAAFDYVKLVSPFHYIYWIRISITLFVFTTFELWLRLGANNCVNGDSIFSSFIKELFQMSDIIWHRQIYLLEAYYLFQLHIKLYMEKQLWLVKHFN